MNFFIGLCIFVISIQISDETIQENKVLNLKENSFFKKAYFKFTHISFKLRKFYFYHLTNASY